MSSFFDQTLAGIVTSNHRAAGVFEKYNLDFCCKGKRTLAEACLENSVDMPAVENELNLVNVSQNNKQMPFTEMSAEQLISHILVKHHFYVKQSVPLIQAHIQKVAIKHGDHFPYMQEVFTLFAKVNKDMMQHMEKEEKILFPRIKEVELVLNRKEQLYIQEVFVSGPVQAMETEHERTGEIMFAIRRLTNNYTVPEGACTTFKICLAELKEFEEDLHEHVHLENNILFPKAINMFNNNALSAITD